MVAIDRFPSFSDLHWRRNERLLSGSDRESATVRLVAHVGIHTPLPLTAIPPSPFSGPMAILTLSGFGIVDISTTESRFRSNMSGLPYIWPGTNRDSARVSDSASICSGHVPQVNPAAFFVPKWHRPGYPADRSAFTAAREDATAAASNSRFREEV